MKLKQYTVLALFAVAGALSLFGRVDRHAQAKSINLSAIPTVIGAWRMIGQDTRVGSKEGKFLDDVLVRAYRRPDGETVMLAVAYGADQRKNFSIHLPEYCYKASGCTVMQVGQAVMSSPNLKLRQVLARRPDGSVEAVQYWIVLGGQVVTDPFENKLRCFYMSMIGEKSEGVLVKISSIVGGDDYQEKFKTQHKMITDLHSVLDPKKHKLIFGN